MQIITEQESAGVITHKMAFEAVEKAFVAAAENATLFPVVIGHSHDPANIFGVKSASTESLTGLKVGTYWASNTAKGLPAHGTTIVLLDNDTGKWKAVVEAAEVNAYRTAAADAVATHYLSRKNARTLALFGTGHQAYYECLALSEVKSLEKVLVVGRTTDKTQRFCDSLQARGINAVPAAAEAACKEADIIVTATLSRAPLFEAAWVQPGTHVVSMGSDSKGKQELPPALFEKATLFCDLPSQSCVVGEFQHASENADLIAIGDVIAGRHTGRMSEEEITVFDSSGISTQDLMVAEAILNTVSQG